MSSHTVTILLCLILGLSSILVGEEPPVSDHVVDQVKAAIKSRNYDPDELLTKLDHHLTTNPHDPDAIKYKVWLLKEKGEYRKACDLAEESFDFFMKSENGGTMYFGLMDLKIRCHAYLHEFYEARRLLNLWWALYQDSDEEKDRYDAFAGDMQFQIDMYNCLHAAAFLKDQGLTFEEGELLIAIDVVTFEAAKKDSDLGKWLPESNNDDENWSIVVANTVSTTPGMTTAVRLVDHKPVAWSRPSPAGAGMASAPYTAVDVPIKKEEELPFVEFVPKDVTSDAGERLLSIVRLSDEMTSKGLEMMKAKR